MRTENCIAFVKKVIARVILVFLLASIRVSSQGVFMGDKRHLMLPLELVKV